MFNFAKNFTWYPPAEIKLPWSAIIGSFTANQRENFRTEFCRYLDVEHCVLGSTARALLFKLLKHLNKKDGGHRSEVLIPGYSCYSVAAAVARAGMKIAVYDLDPKTLHPDLESIKKAISEKTLAVITQHLFGMHVPTKSIKEIAHKNGSYLIEDAAQALGKSMYERRLVIFDDFCLFSFGRGKPLPIGGGGALVSRNYSDIIENITTENQSKGYRQVLLSSAAQVISRPSFYWIAEMLPIGLGKTEFDPNFHLQGISKLNESMLANAFPILHQLNIHRKNVSSVYTEHIPNKYLIGKSDKSSSIIRFPVMLSNIRLTKKIKRLGIRKMYPKPIQDEHTIKPFLTANLTPTPGSSEISERLITLPTHVGIDKDHAKRISNLVRAANKKLAT